MNKLITFTIATVLFTSSAHADNHGRANGIAQFLNAVAQAAQQGRNAHAERQKEYQPEYGYEEAGYGDYGPQSYDLRGDWVMAGGKMNRFQKTHQGYYVNPVGRGRGVHYVEIGENLYQDANSSGTYEVVNENYMVWSSNDKRNLVIELYRR
jgi:hypothetical protein